MIYFSYTDGFHRRFFGSRRTLRVFCPGLHRLMPSGAEPIGETRIRVYSVYQ